MVAPPRSRRTQMRQTEPPVEQKNFLRQLAPFLGVKEYAPGDTYWDKVSKNWASNPMNPVPQTWGAISEGRAPTGREIGTDAAFWAGAGLLGGGIRGVKKAAEGVRRAMDPIETVAKLDLDPATTARMLALQGRLFHGKKGNTYEQSPHSFDILPESPLQFQNWFDGDFFATPSAELASTYGDLYRISSVPNNLRVLDLMPGGRSIADQSPELASMLRRVFGPEEAVSSLTRHKPYTEAVLGNLNDPAAVGSMNKILRDYGYNALRHVSGQGAGRGSGLEEPVYVFFGPEGMKATSTINRAASNVERVGSRVADSFHDFLLRQNIHNPQLLSQRSKDFLKSRGTVRRGSFSIGDAPSTRATQEGNKPFNPYPFLSKTFELLAKPFI